MLHSYCQRNRRQRGSGWRGRDNSRRGRRCPQGPSSLERLSLQPTTQKINPQVLISLTPLNIAPKIFGRAIEFNKSYVVDSMS